MTQKRLKSLDFAYVSVLEEIKTIGSRDRRNPAFLRSLGILGLFKKG